LPQLARHDERISAHLDGIAVAGEMGIELCKLVLDPPSAGAMFAAAVGTIESRNAERLRGLLNLARAVHASRPGLASALGWVSASSLRGITKALLESPDPWWQELGVAACAMHRVDPGEMIGRAMTCPDESVRVRALRAAACLGRIDLRGACVDAMHAGSPALTLEAGRAALLLGERSTETDAMQRFATEPGRSGDIARALLLKLATAEQARALLKVLHGAPTHIRELIRAVGSAGDPQYVPWLIGQMEDPGLARIAGESFSLIAGLVIGQAGLERLRPEAFEAGPSDDPADDDVAIDEDDGLPWPDPAKIAAWWQVNSTRFAAGGRYFMGGPPTPTHCLSVLRHGSQRQRHHAAQYLCLLKPGTPLFNIAAPAWRQQRLLAQMSGS
jgi:uncharacterized protein (TIGR02270 family)